ncbi:ribonuclease R [Buchnera aphidicola (Mindarus keteleerifoliae)]|uniref:ribonuclease R n=1 Tax=Buchnera aphidicola TaxID=9 RepID=UPI0031B674A0
MLKLVKGEIIGNRNGYGFLKTSLFEKDIWISENQMKEYIHGDVVLARLINISWNKNNKIKIIKLLKPNKQNIIGKYHVRENLDFVLPYDNKFSFKIYVAKNKKNNNLSNSMVLIRLIQRPKKNKKAIGKIVQILGRNINVFLIKKIVLKIHNIPNLWSNKIKSELNLLKKKEIAKKNNGYKDMTHLPLVTVDEENAKDFDDAIFCEKNKNSEWVLYVAIADVSSYVKENTFLDREAFNRGNSIYIPTNEVIPMFPKEISENLCSLLPNKKKLVLICEITISEDGKLISYKHYEAKIKSVARLTYIELNDIWIGKKSLLKKYKYILKHLLNFFSFYDVLKKLKLFRKSLFLNRTEPKFILNDYFQIKKISSFTRNKAHKLIELSMLTANVVSAFFIIKNSKNALYRVHDKPNKDKIFKFQRTLELLGLKSIKNEFLIHDDYINFLKFIKNHSDKEMIQTFFLQSMKQAKYSSINIGHFGLALSEYVHFTSPIRRYSDLLIHRIIKNLISRKKDSFLEIKNIESIGNHCSMTERRAEFVSRDILEWMKCEFVKDKIKDSFVAIIYNLFKDKISIHLRDLFIDGFVYLKDLSHESYFYNGEKKQMIGKNTKKIYKIGDQLKVKILAVDSEDRRIRFDIVS